MLLHHRLVLTLHGLHSLFGEARDDIGVVLRNLDPGFGLAGDDDFNAVVDFLHFDFHIIGVLDVTRNARDDKHVPGLL